MVDRCTTVFEFCASGARDQPAHRPPAAEIKSATAEMEIVRVLCCALLVFCAVAADSVRSDSATSVSITHSRRPLVLAPRPDPERVCRAYLDAVTAATATAASSQQCDASLYISSSCSAPAIVHYHRDCRSACVYISRVASSQPGPVPRIDPASAASHVKDPSRSSLTLGGDLCELLCEAYNQGSHLHAFFASW